MSVAVEQIPINMYLIITVGATSLVLYVTFLTPNETYKTPSLTHEKKQFPLGTI